MLATAQLKVDQGSFRAWSTARTSDPEKMGFRGLKTSSKPRGGAEYLNVRPKEQHIVIVHMIYSACIYIYILNTHIYMHMYPYLCPTIKILTT